MSYKRKTFFESFELSENRLSDSLKDAGCELETIIQFTKMFEEHNYDEAILILQKQRTELLEDLHCAQKRLDCLDYLIYLIKKIIPE